MSKQVTAITIHSAATYPSMDIGAEDIREWHTKPPHNFKDIGYHYVIRRDGTVEKGRKDTQIGAHTGRNNTYLGGINIGICLVGGLKEGSIKKGKPNGIAEDNYTDEQWESLDELIFDLLDEHGDDLVIKGHNGWKQHASRMCPCFDWEPYVDDLLERYRDNDEDQAIENPNIDDINDMSEEMKDAYLEEALDEFEQEFKKFKEEQKKKKEGNFITRFFRRLFS